MALYSHNLDVYNHLTDALKRANDIILIHGTGLGKSFLLIELLNNYYKDSRILYVVPKYTVKENFSEYDEVKNSSLDIDFVTYNYFSSERKALDAYKKYDFFILDEVHHIGSDIYGQNARLLLCKVKTSRKKKLLGLTATNYREDKIDVADYFSEKVLGISIFAAIEEGLIPQFEYLVCDTNVSEFDKKHFRQKIDYKKSLPLLKDTISRNPKNRWICYFTNIKELEEKKEIVRDAFPDDYKLIAITSKHSANISQITVYDKTVVLSVDKIIEGVHTPDTQGVILFRKVGSLRVFQQILGRVTSVDNRENPLIIDCTETAYKMLRKLLNYGTKEHRQHDNNDNKRPILVCSLQNTEHFNVEKVLGLMDLKAEKERKQKVENTINKYISLNGIVYNNYKELQQDKINKQKLYVCANLYKAPIYYVLKEMFPKDNINKNILERG